MRTCFGAPFRTLQEILHEEKIIEDIQHLFCDFAVDVGVTNPRPGSQLKDPALGAGSLMAYGIYSLSWGILLSTTRSAKLPPNRTSHPPRRLSMVSMSLHLSSLPTHSRGRRE